MYQEQGLQEEVFQFEEPSTRSTAVQYTTVPIWYAKVGKFHWEGQQILQIGCDVNRIAQQYRQKVLCNHPFDRGEGSSHVQDHVPVMSPPFHLEGLCQGSKSSLGIALGSTCKEANPFNPWINLQLYYY